MSVELLGTFHPDNLIVGVGVGIKIGNVTIASGSVLQRGSLLAKGSDGKCTLLTPGGDDSQPALYAVLSDDTDASEGDVVAEAYIAGEFSIEHCIAGEGTDIESLADEARKLNIYLVHTKE